ncbi:hypothetical protein CC80DRAFT_554849 [Byssothecium circinans]|uniref:Uncharacterized protein n=1 Tax=Byssothecium circinans TaxID=147558 RepID=A0A6A5TCD2_9PLEO|nr:hypothetical protein CC80DRAFT_554849 [Byssothecium circinans]
MSSYKRERAVLLGNDSVQDELVDEEGAIFIAIGTQAGKVMVFNVLGLLVHEVDMGASIVALEWMGDMSAPSILPNRRGSLPPYPFIEEAQPVLDTLLQEIVSPSEDEEDGTVKKTAFSTKRADRSPVRLDGVRDLFSPELNAHMSHRPPSVRSNGSPPKINRSRDRPKRKPYRRPRIMTETFKRPSFSPTRQLQLIDSTHSSESSPLRKGSGTKEPRHTSRDAFDIFFSDALRPSSLSSSRASSDCSHAPESEEYFTPPTSQKPKRKDSPLITIPYSQAAVAKPPYRHVLPRTCGLPPDGVRRSPFTKSPPSIPAKSPARKNLFPACISPKGYEGKQAKEGWNESWLERSPFPAPPGQSPKRDYDFEPGAQEEERRYGQLDGKCERRLSGEKSKSGRAEAWWKDDYLKKDESMRSQVKDTKVANTTTGGLQRASDRVHNEPSGLKRRDRLGRVMHHDEDDALRREMVLLREEFRALREVLLGSRKNTGGM